MGFDEEYLDSLLKSIEPIVNPDGEIPEGTDPEEIPDMPEEELDSEVAEPEEIDTMPTEPEPAEPTEVETTVPTETEAATEIPEAAPVDMEASDAQTEVLEESDAVTEVGEEFNPLNLLDYDPDDGGKILSPDEISAMFNTVNSAIDANEKNEETKEADELDINELLTEAAEPVEVAGDDDALAALLSDGSDVTDIGDEFDLSEEELEKMLSAAKENADDGLPGENEDLISLLAEVGDEDLSDIQDILDSDESGAAVAAAALDATTNVEDVAANVLETEKEAKARKKKEKKEAKKNKKKAKADGTNTDAEAGEKKKGFFAKIIDALTEPVDEDEFGIGEAVIVETDETISSESGMTGISDENKEILAELDEEKGKKKKSKKKKKDKKGKKGEEPAPEGEEGEEGAEAEPKKKKKPKKEKKAKTVKEKEPSKPEKKLPKKKVRVTFLFGFTLLAAILICVFGMTKLNNLKEARWAFDNQDYQTTYDDLYGIELKGEDAEIFAKSQAILQLERKYKSYQNYSRLGMSYEAVDALIEGVKVYPAVREKAQAHGVEGQVDYTYSLIITALQNLGVSEADALEIITYDSKVKYTKRIQSIANGTPFTYDEDIIAEEMGEAPEVFEESNDLSVDDILPEESDFLPGDPESIFENMQ